MHKVSREAKKNITRNRSDQKWVKRGFWVSVKRGRKEIGFEGIMSKKVLTRLKKISISSKLYQCR